MQRRLKHSNMAEGMGDDFNQAQALKKINAPWLRRLLAQLDHSRVDPSNELERRRPSFQFLNTGNRSREQLSPAHEYMNDLEWVANFKSEMCGFFNAGAVEVVTLDFLTTFDFEWTVPVILQGHCFLMGRQRERSVTYVFPLGKIPLPFVLRRNPRMYELPEPWWVKNAERTLNENYEYRAFKDVVEEFPWMKEHLCLDNLLRLLVISPVLENTRTKYLLKNLPKNGWLKQVQKGVFLLDLCADTKEDMTCLRAAIGQWAKVSIDDKTKGPMYISGISDDMLVLTVGAKHSVYSDVQLPNKPIECRMRVHHVDMDDRIRFTAVVDCLASIRDVILPMTVVPDIGLPLVNPETVKALQTPGSLIFLNENLTDKQKLAVEEILLHRKPNSVYVVSGAAGCGKSEVLKEVTLQLHKNHMEWENWDALTIFAAPTNSAAESIVKGLVRAGIPEQNIIYLVSEHQLDRLGQPPPYVQQASKSTVSAQHFVMVGTVGAVVKRLMNKKAETSRAPLLLILDEAAAVAFADAAALILHAGQPIQIVLAGDVNQLKPKTLSRLNAVLHGTTSIIDITRLSPVIYSNALTVINQSAADYQRYPCPNTGYGVVLTDNFRAHPHLVETASDLFYDGLMVPGEGHFDMGMHENMMAKLQELPIFQNTFKQASLFWVDFDGQMELEWKSNSPYNVPEANVVSNLTNMICGQLGADKVTVLSPYKAQVTTLKGFLGQSMSIHTVDEIQGLEREVVIISLVRCLKGLDKRIHQLGFLNSKERCNVMLSRGKNVVVFVGSRLLFTTATSSFWPKLYGRCLPLISHSIV